MTNNLNKFLKGLKASPPAGLVISRRRGDINTVEAELKKLNVPFVVLKVDLELYDADFFDQLNKAWRQKAWLVLDIAQDVPPIIYSVVRTLDGTGHITDTKSDRDYDLYDSATRVLGVMRNQDLEKSAFDTLMYNFGMIYRIK